MIEQGVFVALEGGDGSGKGTQTALLEQERQELGKNVLRLSFPQYDESSSYYSAQYLNGEYGGINDVHPDLASLTYAVDRFAAKARILQALEDGDDVLLDRWVASNLAHQGAKIHDKAKRQDFYARTLDLEYGTLGLPQPQKNIVLLVPPSISQENVDKKAARSYTDKKRDIHEADPLHLEYAKRNYEELCELYPELYTAIECVEDGKMRSIEDIRAEINTIVDRL
jgi:dTMP kinase